jgi:GDP-L-fucose synthase
MTILVAGGSGLVGSAIVRELKRLNQDVIGISSKDVDLLDRNKTFEFIKNLKPMIIIDSAAKAGGIGGNNLYPVEFLSKNLQIQCNLMDAAHAAKVSKFVFLGSSCIYPKDCAQPMREEYLLTGELEQTNSAYSVAKIAGIELVKSYRREYGYKWISVMPTNMYGPYDNFDLENGHVLPVLIRKFLEAKQTASGKVTLWGSGAPLREFMHADDFAKAVLVCMDKYDDSKQINVGSGQEVSIKDLADKISKAVGFSGEISWDSSKPDGTMRKVLDSSKISNLGWKPLISLDQGIASTVDWYLQNK